MLKYLVVGMDGAMKFLPLMTFVTLGQSQQKSRQALELAFERHPPISGVNSHGFAQYEISYLENQQSEKGRFRKGMALAVWLMA